jgi:hypothetical protein
MFQSKAGYIDARPLTANSSKNFLQRTAGPYIRVIFNRPSAALQVGRFRFAQEADRKPGASRL